MTRDTIDAEGYRANVGIIICNDSRELLWARRAGQGGWQFPQGGIREDESPREAMYRELREEVGLEPDDVEILATTRDWCRYKLPNRYLRKNVEPLCIGQKQRWFLLRLLASESSIRFDAAVPAEFDHWRWVDRRLPAREVIFFKRRVYARVLREFRPLLDVR